MVLAKSKRAAEASGNHPAVSWGKLKLKMNVGKSKVVSVFAIRNFKFLGFALGKGKNGIYIRAHTKSLKKAKAKLKELTSRSQGRNVRVVMQKVKGLHPGLAGLLRNCSMKTTMREWDKWLRRRYRMYIWKQWKKPKTRAKSLMQLGIPEWQARAVSNCRKPTGTWRRTVMYKGQSRNKRLARAGYYSILDRYESVHLCD